MKADCISLLAGVALAGILLSSVETRADNGFTISRNRESVVAVGMSASEVRQLIGRPARAARYGNAPGPIWTYRVIDSLFGKTEFNVEFSADERVITKGEIVIGNEAPNTGTRD